MVYLLSFGKSLRPTPSLEGEEGEKGVTKARGERGGGEKREEGEEREQRRDHPLLPLFLFPSPFSQEKPPLFPRTILQRGAGRPSENEGGNLYFFDTTTPFPYLFV